MYITVTDKLLDQSRKGIQVSEMNRQAERVIGGAGEWIIRNGKFYDPVRGMWILKCQVCKHAFYFKRIDAKTCGDACRQKLARKKAAYAERMSDASTHD